MAGMMIQTQVDIQCDVCGVIERREHMVKFRTDALMPMTAKDLQDFGWRFERNAEWELTRVICKHCRDKTKPEVR